MKSLKVVLVNAEQRQAASAAGATQLSAGQDLEMKRHLQEISELKQQVISLAVTEPSVNQSINQSISVIKSNLRRPHLLS